MSTTTERPVTSPARTEHLDVLVVGAGLSGIGAAAHLRKAFPGRSLAVLEARAAIGGTWDLFRYPGVRSDSDMFTLGYSFRPWTDPKAIADGDAIRGYLEDTIDDLGLRPLIRLGHRVVSADWSSDEARWTVRVDREGEGPLTLTTDFLFVCSGYYRYDRGFTPDFPGSDDFTGDLVHPQLWPADLDWTDKDVVVIGSGATAVTLVPALATTAKSVTMLQRSPTYVASVPSRDAKAERLAKRLPARVAYRVNRIRHIAYSTAVYRLSRTNPAKMKAMLRAGVRAATPKGFDVDTHFAPRYDPWDQRLCAVPDGDLFAAIRSGKADVATDGIERFTPEGIALTSGRTLPADVIVTATGLDLLFLGGMTLSVDGAPVEANERLTYKGMMLSGVPNFALTIGYTNASWTLKSDLVATYVVRILRRMRRRGETVVVPVAPAAPGELTPLIDLSAGYIRRAADRLPKQGAEAPWRLHQNYVRDLLLLRFGRITDQVRFSKARRKVAA